MDNKIEIIKNNSPVKKADIIILFLLIALIVFSVLVISPKGNGKTAEIYSDGKLIKVMDLNTPADYLYEYNGHYNVITVKGGKIFVTESDCLDKICVRCPPADTAGNAIICLPHKLIIVIKGGGSGYDGIIFTGRKKL